MQIALSKLRGLVREAIDPLVRAAKVVSKDADRASSKTRFGHYPMAPSVGLSDKEIEKHRPAMQKHRAAAEAWKRAGDLKQAQDHERAAENHSWVVHRRGEF